MTSPLNYALLRLPKRAEASARELLIKTFVDVGPLFTLLNGPDHQVLFGRRGTGKTHALTYLAGVRESKGDVVATIDLRSVGSSAGLYADETIPLPERATRLIVDTLSAIHSTLVGFFVDRAEELDLAVTGPKLDRLAEAITQVKVVGPVERETKAEQAQSSKASSGAAVNIGVQDLGLRLSSDDRLLTSSVSSAVIKRSGTEQLYLNFGETGSAFRDIAERLDGRRLWVLLDEWSSVPLSLQPYLADLIRRSLLPISGLTVKIGAIEQRSLFRIAGARGEYIGIEVGADVSADANLDDFMVFDNDEQRATQFFQDLIVHHVRAVTQEEPSLAELPSESSKIIAEMFTEKRAIEEFVRACEGVPRDAINIIALAAQRALKDRISVQHIRVAARNWYQRDKERAAIANEKAQRLLHWVIDEVIGQRRARAFLLRSDIRDVLIESLYDSRVLHILKRTISTHDDPGVRYDVYKLDYGCYVDLVTTAKSPQGLLPLGQEPDAAISGYTEVPPDDYRSIRRAILDLTAFYRT